MKSTYKACDHKNCSAEAKNMIFPIIMADKLFEGGTGKPKNFLKELSVDLCDHHTRTLKADLNLYGIK